MRKGLLALEDMLEVDKLYEQKEQANKSSETSSIVQDIKTDNKIEEEVKDNEEDVSTDEASTNESEVSGDETDTSTDDISNDSDITYDEKKDVDEVSDTEETEAIESFRLITYNRIAEEDWKETAINIGDHLLQAGKYLGHLGLTYGPDILKHTYKGVVYLMGKIVKLLFTSINSTYRYVKRRMQSFDNIKKDINNLKEAISELKNKEELTDLSDIKYTNKGIINTLKIADKVDFNNNIMVLQKFIINTIEQIDKHIKKDISFIMHLTSSTMNNDLKSPDSLMKVESLGSDFTNKAIKGYGTDTELLDSFTYKNVLPGDILFITHIPKQDITEFNQIIEAYNKSKMFLTLNQETFEVVDSINYMDINGIENYLNTLEKLCDVCIAHEIVYNDIIKLKKQLRFSFKRYFNAIITSKEKVSLKNSLTEYVYLKSMFIDKVYLPAAMDIHDYAAKVMVASINYMSENIKRL